MSGIDGVVENLKQNIGFERVLKQMYDVYRQRNRAFGAVRLSRPTPEEEAALSLFFNRDYYNQALIRVGLADFERQAGKHAQEEVSLGDIFAGLYGQPKKAKQSQPVVSPFATVVLKEILPRFADTPSEVWLKEIAAQTRRTYRLWAEKYIYEPANIAQMVTTVADAVNKLPMHSDGGKLKELSGFSYAVTGSEDTFGADTPCGMLFIRAVARRLDMPLPSTTEETTDLLRNAGIISHGALSCVMARGVKNVFEGFQPYAVSLLNINNAGNIGVYGEKFYVIESPEIFSAVCENFMDSGEFTAVCPAFGFNAAFSQLVKMLEGNKMYYLGDFNYGSLVAADNLYLMYGRDFVPWHYSKEVYEGLVSGSSGFLPDYNKQHALHNEELATLLSYMKKTQKTASAMPLVKGIVEEISASLLV